MKIIFFTHLLNILTLKRLPQPFTIRRMQHIYSSIDTNTYVMQCKTNKKKEVHSLSYLIDRELSQSDCIKMGYGIENVMKEYILSNNRANLVNIKPKNKKGQKEKDHLFMDDAAKIIYYAELKSNLNLDTEKCKSTSEKCLIVEKELKEEFPDYDVRMFLVSNRHYCRDIIPGIIMKKYSNVENNVVGMRDYFHAVEVEFPFEGEDEYKRWLNYLADKMFSEVSETGTV